MLSTAGKCVFAAALALIAWTIDAPPASASPARFWLSLSNTNPTGPEAPTLTGVMGATRQLHIWAQPATVNPADPYNVSTNRFRTFENLSLDLVASAPIVDFVDGSFTIYNPSLDGNLRYQFVSDSFTPVTEVSGPLVSEESEADVMAGNPDSIEGLQAFSISTTGIAGLGHSPSHTTLGCHPADTFCAATGDGSPAWLVASVSFKTLASAGSAQLFVRIGANGVNYQGDTEQAAAVTFGINALTPAPTYDARIVAQRGITLAGDDPDATINAVAGIPGDFNQNAVVDAADYVTWRDGLGTIFMESDYNVWRSNFGVTAGSGAAAAPAALTVVPEPATVLLTTLACTCRLCWLRPKLMRPDRARS